MDTTCMLDIFHTPKMYPMPHRPTSLSMCIDACVRAHTHARAHTHTLTHTHSHTCASAHKYAHIHVHKHTTSAQCCFTGIFKMALGFLGGWMELTFMVRSVGTVGQIL